MCQQTTSQQFPTLRKFCREEKNGVKGEGMDGFERMDNGRDISVSR